MREFQHIFTPLKIGQMVMKNRIEFPPVGSMLAVNGLVSSGIIEWGRSLARGGAALVTLGDSAVIQLPDRPGGGALNLGSDRAIEPLKMFVQAVHEYSALASIQLNHHVSCLPDEMGHEEIHRIITGFSDASYRCLQAGMDMVMVHGAHGQIISQFVSPRQNHRTDSYGGSLANRARFAVEVLEAIRGKVGHSLAIEYRISGDELVQGGLSTEEQLEFADLIQDKIDLIHISAGKLYADETLSRMFPPSYFPRGANVPLAERFKKALRIPVAVVGGIDLSLAEQILTQNKADVAALGRALIADPDSVNKARTGCADQIRPCIRCNSCIDRTHRSRLPVRCAVNPLAGREAELANLLPPVPNSSKNGSGRLTN